jgi:hypothetical protein
MNDQMRNNHDAGDGTWMRRRYGALMYRAWIAINDFLGYLYNTEFRYDMGTILGYDTLHAWKGMGDGGASALCTASDGVCWALWDCPIIMCPIIMHWRTCICPALHREIGH